MGCGKSASDSEAAVRQPDNSRAASFGIADAARPAAPRRRGSIGNAPRASGLVRLSDFGILCGLTIHSSRCHFVARLNSSVRRYKSNAMPDIITISRFVGACITIVGALMVVVVWLRPVKISPGVRLVLDGSGPDEITATITNKSNKPIYSNELCFKGRLPKALHARQASATAFHGTSVLSCRPVWRHYTQSSCERTCQG